MSYSHEVENATRDVRNAIETFGAPVWVAHVTQRTRSIVPRNVKRDLIENASISEGWSYHQGQYIHGRLDARSVLIEWAKANVFEVMTIKDIAIAAKVSQSAVRTMIDTRADIFRKSDGRTFEVRDANGDRRNDKGK